ncbi:GlxA family transcriptional regulator [Niabella drilacis]|uniref:Transcriptional regulator GlxA family, contains an amidase domain and an AraC-type DNA-binding HTH domain n=1 Tax=Niabella drilacis (strain DSM 25811 / CCM 8410 / CCUG 62505 / LMG 26954 / E90) TaxID=1285928 RepID=A0A1G6M325_NIADE|nr:helix-turn-helix domain-containing protein [Niabella drilacis]SDC49889.1 Transcriptional regulator GlxA family, contains an amidase domain and an AraC-type DNA-binding HTH domain [Niabella drilacis]
MKHVTIVVPDCRVNVNTIGGAYDILCRANEYWKQAGHPSLLTIEIAGFVPEVRSHNGYLSIRPADIRTIRHTDLVLIPAVLGGYEEAVQQNQELLDWIRLQYKCGAEVASMCSGGFLLAATGLLQNRACSIHWNKTEEFERMFPGITIATGKIITHENGIYTNGGAYSFLNLVLYLVEILFDRSVAIFCSKVFQIDVERITQSPFTIFQVQKEHDDELIRDAQTYIEEHLDTRISFEKLAVHLAVSRRNFDRRFIRATGNTPVEYLQRVKIEAAKKELERGRKTIFEVMMDVGYTDDKTFRDVFRKITGLSPADYRNRYNKERISV